MNAQMPAQLHQGQVLANRYVVQNLIGRGGMGCIYKVQDNVLQEVVALKTLLPQFVRDRVVVERFFNEARIARRLAHPNIVRVHDIGSTEGVVYISMEFLEGKSLRSILEARAPGERLPLAQVFPLFDELCAALEYAHRYTVHRDIKPENVMVLRDGTVKLMDFGISKLMANTRLTGASMVMGTPFYMSPEQIKNSRDVDARADVYSVGVMLYEVLTGQLPSGVAKRASELHPELPRELDAIVDKCVDQDPQKRYQSAAELRAHLRQVREQVLGPIQDNAQTLLAPGLALARGRKLPLRKIAGALIAAALLVASGAGVYGLEQRREEALAEWRNAGIVTGPATPEERFAGLEVLVPWARRLAEERAGAAADLKSICGDAAAKWAEAKATLPQDPAQAVQLGQEALSCYLAAPLWQTGMVLVPGGTVTLGEESVYVPPFLIDRAEVTLREFNRFTKQVDGGWRFPPELEGIDFSTYAKYPVMWVSYYDAQGYASWLNKELPTEAQWARAAYDSGEPGRFAWGPEWKPDNANTALDSVQQGVAPVMSFEDDRSWAGCYDMTGNVSEWTCSNPGAPQPAEATPADFHQMMVVKGGNFRSEEEPLLWRATTASYGARSETIGFRCVVNLPVEQEVIADLLAKLDHRV